MRFKHVVKTIVGKKISQVRVRIPSELQNFPAKNNKLQWQLQTKDKKMFTKEQLEYLDYVLSMKMGSLKYVHFTAGHNKEEEISLCKGILEKLSSELKKGWAEQEDRKRADDNRGLPIADIAD